MVNIVPACRISHARTCHHPQRRLMRTGNKRTIFGVTKQSGLDLEKEPRPSGRGEAFFLTSLFIELIDPNRPFSISVTA